MPTQVPTTHLELKVRVFQELLVHDFCKLVDGSQEDPGGGEKVIRPSEPSISGNPPLLQRSLRDPPDPRERSADPLTTCSHCRLGAMFALQELKDHLFDFR